MAMIIVSCGFQLREKTYLPNEMKNIIVKSYDPYGPLTRLIMDELRINGVTLIENTDEGSAVLPLLHILNSLENQVTTSVFQNGKTAGYQLILVVQAQIIIPDKDCHPINVKVHRSLFDIPLMALAKDAELDIFRYEIYQQAAQQLIHQLLSSSVVHNVEQVDKSMDTKLQQQQLTVSEAQ